jgi:hypothetical protein
MPDDIGTARQILRERRDELLGRANVLATGVGYKVTAGERTSNLSVVCSVREKVSLSELAASDRVPKEVGGIPTDVVSTGGPLRAFQAPTGRFRPAPGGVSIGHRDITAGTLGCLVRRDGVTYILSNNHVLANSNAASPGDPILQPGPHDGGTVGNDRIADLTEFVEISFGDSPSDCPVGQGAAAVLNAAARMMGSSTRLNAVRIQATDNLVDAAIARPLRDEDVLNEILQIGTIAGSASGELGMAIKKSGRTTGFTTGQIQQVDVTADVQYGAGQVARFTDQLLAGAMSQGGDSGSAVLDDQNRLVGLLFAGSETTTIINRIENVFSALNVGL